MAQDLAHAPPLPHAGAAMTQEQAAQRLALLTPHFDRVVEEFRVLGPALAHLKQACDALVQERWQPGVQGAHASPLAWMRARSRVVAAEASAPAHLEARQQVAQLQHLTHLLHQCQVAEAAAEAAYLHRLVPTSEERLPPFSAAAAPSSQEE
jgi:hypothetical protein